MSGGYYDHADHGAAVTDFAPSVPKIAGVSTGLVLLNIVLMLPFSVPPLSFVGRALFMSHILVAMAAFAVLVGGGKWLAVTGIESERMALAAGGVLVTEVGFGLFGGAVLSLLGPGAILLKVVALGITAVLTAIVTAIAVGVVYKTDHSFERWNWYSMGLFVVGAVLAVAGAFVLPLLVPVASLVFLLAFTANLIYEVWAVKTNRYASDLRNAVGIYVAVTGVFVNILIWVVRLLSILGRR